MRTLLTNDNNYSYYSNDMKSTYRRVELQPLSSSAMKSHSTVSMQPVNRLRQLDGCESISSSIVCMCVCVLENALHTTKLMRRLSAPL